MPKDRTVLIDRDGVIVRNRDDYVKTIAEMEFLPGAIESLARLSRNDHRVFVVTNQSAIGRGLTTLEEVERMHEGIAEAVRREGGQIEAFLICPHTPADRCDCRKPAPGLLFQARDRYRVDLRSAVLIGDASSDIAAAQAAGCANILVLTGVTSADADLVPDKTVEDLAAAVDLILSSR